MGFTPEERLEITAIVDERLKEDQGSCSSGITREDHLASHVFLQELQKTLVFASEVKKGVLILVLGGFVLFIGGALLSGLAIVLSSKVPTL